MIEWFNETLVALVAAINIGNPAGLMAICLLAILADIGIPFPFALDAILFFTVYRLGPFSLPVFLIVGMLLVGRFIGTSIIYAPSRIYGNKFVDWIGRRSHYIKKKLPGIRSKSTQWSIWVIVAGRLTPGLMQVATITAGALRLPYYRLALAIVLSAVIYDGILISLGYLARIGLKNIGPEYSIWIVLSFVFIMVVIYYIVNRLHVNREKPIDKSV